MNTLKTILVAVDFSTGSRAALDQAVRIAARNEAKLHVLHVVDQAAVVAMLNSLAPSYESQAKSSCEGASAALDRWMEHVPLPAGCEIHIVMGTPMHEILERCQALKADLLVAGIAGAGNSPAGAGSVSSKLVRKAGTRVLLVRANHAHPFRKIIACIDFSEASREVAEQARRAALQDGASVDFLHVWQDPWESMPYTMTFADMGVPVMPATPEQRKAFVQNLRRELKLFVGSAAQGIQSTEVLHEASNYGNGIVAHALVAMADLIIVGGKGRTNLRYVLLGSTAERLLTQIPCSMLVVKEPAAEQAGPDNG